MQKASPTADFNTDLVMEHYAPDHIIRIKDLSQGEMQAEWNTIRTKQGAHYRYLRKNCSTVVSRVLKAGGERGSGSVRNNLVWTPLKVKRLAIEMGGEEMAWSSFLEMLVGEGGLGKSDAQVLLHLYKRDTKHGKAASGNQSYYSKGQKINEKPFLLWGGGVHKLNDEKLGETKSQRFFQANGGSIMTSGERFRENGRIIKRGVVDEEF